MSQQTTESDLLYNGKPVAAEPINTSLELLAKALQLGQPVIAKLEPGDGTHYCLLVVPCWADNVGPHLGRYGIRPHTADEYLIATYLHDTSGESFYVFRDPETWDIHDGIKNQWTREFFAWWFKALWVAILGERL